MNLTLFVKVATLVMAITDRITPHLKSEKAKAWALPITLAALVALCLLIHFFGYETLDNAFDLLEDLTEAAANIEKTNA